MSNLHNALATLEYQQMLDRERMVVQDLHDRGLCLKDGCVICREEAEKMKDLDHTLEQRGQKYGDYGYMATCAQRIKEAMGAREHMSAVQRESLDVIATKIARLCCGDPNDRDSWHDIQGYAKLVEDRLPVQGAGSNSATS